MIVRFPQILNNLFHLVCIYPQDIVWLTGRNERYAREVIKDIKLLHRKERHQLVTIKEFCDFMGLPYDEVFAIINKASP